MAIGACPILPWQGYAWRAHKRRYEATDWRGSLRVSGRYHRGADRFPQEQIWPALYLGLTYGICLAEIARHLTPVLFSQLKEYRFSRIKLDLVAVVDCRSLGEMRLTPEELFEDFDYEVGQNLAIAARTLRCEGMLVPSAARLPDDILIIFPDLVRPQSSLRLEESVDPVLYVQRPGD